MPVHHVLKEPLDVYFVDGPSASPFEAKESCYQQMKDIEKKYRDCLFRSVAIDRYESIARNYIDVEPADAVIFADCLEKALEYGDWPKLLLILRSKSMSRSFRCVPDTTSPTELERIRREYPTLVDLNDGTLWFSRLQQGDSRLASGYESAYGWYVSGNPREALAALVICCRPEDLSIAQRYLLNAREQTVG
jgi:hypothetical protein